jgi:BlaI family penicillinase repressor
MMPLSKTSAAKPSATPAISDSEWVVMREFWARGEATSGEVIEAVMAIQAWKPPTVQTLITRLVKKGALTFTRNGREYRYRPLVREEDCVHGVSRSFVDRVFGGSLAPLLSCFVEREKLSKAEIEELKRILDEGGHAS